MKKSDMKENMTSNETEAGPEAKNPEEQEAVNSETSAKGNNASERNMSSEEACKKENELLNDQLYRLAADFDNFRKRTARQIEDSKKAVLEGLLVELLEVSDNFERALKSARAAEDMDSVVNGIEQLSRQFSSILEKHGLEKIECERATEFDPYKHEAVHHVETSELPDNTVFEVYKSGYALNSKVIRPAMVVVARNSSPAGEDEQTE